VSHCSRQNLDLVYIDKEYTLINQRYGLARQAAHSLDA